MQDAAAGPSSARSQGPGRPIGVGIVGCGDLARNAVLPHLAQPDALSLARVVALCSRTIERAEALAQLYHVPRVTADYDALLADEEVDAVLILTPARLHFTQALAAVRAGKHVYVQKPMTESLPEALTLEREVERHQVRLVAAPGQGLNPIVPRLRELIHEGAIGAPFWVHAPAPSWGGRDLEFSSNPAWYFREGAGPFRDMAVYALHLLTALFGPARRVSAMQTVTAKRRSWAGRPFFVTAPDNVVAQIEFGESLLATVGAQWCAGGPRAAPFQVGIYGLEGAIESREYLGAWPTAWELRSRTGEVSAVTIDSAAVASLMGAHARLMPHVWADLRHLFACIRGATPEALASVALARHVVEILEAAHRAAETGVTQPLETAF